MTYNTNVPDASQSPGLFPPQNSANFTRLKTIISGDHQFNDTTAANDGTHKQVTLINRANPSSVPAGTNSMIYGKTATDGVNELWFYNQFTVTQIGWRESFGSFVMPASGFVTITAVPTNVYGTIILQKGLIITQGNFVSNGAQVFGYTYVMKYQPGANTNYILRLGAGTEASGLNLRTAREVNTVNGISTQGNWTYRIYYRKT